MNIRLGKLFGRKQYLEGYANGYLAGHEDGYQEAKNRIHYRRIAYKATRNGRSLVATGDACVDYTSGPIQAPKHLAEQGYHLLCYETLEQARSHLAWFMACPSGMGDDFAIWEVEAEDIVDLPPAHLLWALGCSLDVNGYFVKEEWPPGTIMAKTVRLLRRVT